MQLYPSRNDIRSLMKLARGMFRTATLLIGCLAKPAKADDPSIPSVRLKVRAARDCTSQADLRARVAARLPRAAFADDGVGLEATASFTTSQSGNVVGELTLAKPGTQTSFRRIVARSCAQAADAVALIIVVTLDPRAPGETRAESAPSDSAALSKQPSTEPKRDLAERPSMSSEALSTRASSASSLPRFAVHLVGQAQFGVAPGVMPGLGLDAMAGLDRPALWSPAIVLGISHAWRSGVHATGGTAAFALDAVTLEACPFRVVLAPFEGRACGAGLAGVLAARGTHTNNSPGTRSRPFAALGASALGTAKLHANIELWFRAAVQANLERYSFEFGPYVFHSTGPVTVGATIGVGWRSR